MRLLTCSRPSRGILLTGTKRSDWSQVLFFQGNDLNFFPAEGFSQESFNLVSETFGCIGVLPFRREVLVGFVTGATVVGTLEERHTVYRVTSVRFLSLSTNLYDMSSGTDFTDPATGSQVPHPAADVIKYFSSGTFYFCPTLDITSTAQTRSTLPTSDPWGRINSKFFWNSYMVRTETMFIVVKL